MSVIFAASLTVSILTTLTTIINYVCFGVQCELLQALFLIISWLITTICFAFKGLLRVIEIEGIL